MIISMFCKNNLSVPWIINGKEECREGRREAIVNSYQSQSEKQLCLNQTVTVIMEPRNHLVISWGSTW